MKYIGIDANEANVSNRVGVNVYAFELLKAMYLLQDEWKDEFEFEIVLSSPPLPDMPRATSKWKYTVLPGRGLWIIRKLMPYLYTKGRKFDLFFTPGHYVSPFAPMPRICAIMDLGYLEFTGQFKKYDYWQLKTWSAWSMYVSKCIITISETSKKDIVRHYKFTSQKTEVTLLGYDSNKFNTKISEKHVRRVRAKYTMGSKKYILFLSTLKPSKNIEGLLNSWALIADKFSDTVLVIVGKKGWLYESIFQRAKDLGIESKVIFTGFIPEEDKPAIMKGAQVFVLPSFWEGFGLDVLNALASGVPVIVSDRGSLPEVVGESGIVVSPTDPKEISQKIEEVLTMSKSEYTRIVNSGLNRAKEFSWMNTARKTLSIFAKI